MMAQDSQDPEMLVLVGSQIQQGAFQDDPSSFLDRSPQLLYTRSYVQDARMM